MRTSIPILSMILKVKAGLFLEYLSLLAIAFSQLHLHYYISQSAKYRSILLRTVVSPRSSR